MEMDAPSLDQTLREIDDIVNMDVDTAGPSHQSAAALVIDTNILLGHLEVLQDFVDDVEKNQLPVLLVIPGIVVQELDNQKTGRELSLQWASKRASTWVLKKLKDHQCLVGQSYRETLQRSGKWNIRDPGTNNDALIIDCCLFHIQRSKHSVCVVSADSNLCNEAEAQGIHTINPRFSSGGWSSRQLAAEIFGSNFPLLLKLTNYVPKYRPKHVRKALQTNFGLIDEQDARHQAQQDDGMDVDDHPQSSSQPVEWEHLPKHLLDDLHLQIVDHFSILISDLFERASKNARSVSKHSPYAAALPDPNKRTMKGTVMYLASAPKPRAVDEKTAKVLRNTERVGRLGDFLTKLYSLGSRRGQEWPRAVWGEGMETLGAIGVAWEDAFILDSIRHVLPHIDHVFEMPLRPN